MMKKIISVVFAAVLACLLALGAFAVAAGNNAEYTIGTASGFAGDTVEVSLSISTGADANSFGFNNISYDSNALTFLGFGSTNPGDAIFKTFDDNMKLFNVGYMQAQTMNGHVMCVLRFKINDGASGTFPISGNAIVKNGSTPFAVSVNSGSVTVKKNELPSDISFDGAEYTYDGSFKNIEVNLGSAAGISGISVDYDGFSGEKDAGTYNVKATVSAPGYESVIKNATLKINKKDVTINAKVRDKEYDGTSTATFETAPFCTGLVNDGTSVKYTGATFSSKNVASSIKIDHDIALSGGNSKNYNVTVILPNAAITAKTLTVTADTRSVKVGAAMPELTYTVLGLVEGESASDVLSGALAVGTSSTSTAGEYDITVGTLKASSNYKLNFVGAKFKVVDKTPQDITVTPNIPEGLTYGDEGFTVGISNGENVNSAAATTLVSDNTAVVTVDNSGKVNIIGAGSAVITVKREGNADYATFESKINVTVAKKSITVKADAKSKRVGEADPALTYTYEGSLVGNDAFTGALTRKPGEDAGEYDITVGNLALNENYNIIFRSAAFTIHNKSSQNLTVTPIPEKTYGDEAFVIEKSSAEVPDGTYSFVSDNTDVVTVDNAGKVTIVGVGKANISVTNAGNADYDMATVKVSVTVKPKSVSISALDLVEKTANIDGAPDAMVDFDNITLKLGEVGSDSAKVNVSSITLKGENAKNYTLASSEFEATVPLDYLVKVDATSENLELGTVTGAGYYLPGTKVTVKATAADGYIFKNYKDQNGKNLSYQSTYIFVAEENITVTAFFEEKPDELPTFIVTFNDNGEETRFVVYEGYTVERPNEVQREGFIFGGWYTDKVFENEFDFETAVTSDITLYAKWIENAPVITPDPPFITPWENTYTDVNETSWFYNSVKEISEKGIMKGMGDGVFAPNLEVNRAMLVTMLYRIDGENKAVGEVPFTDASSSDYYYDALVWAYNNGIIKGITETEFGGNGTLERQQAAAILYRYAAYKGHNVSAEADLSTFADGGNILDYAVDAMKYAVSGGLFKGNERKELDAFGPLTRAQAATIILRFTELYDDLSETSNDFIVTVHYATPADASLAHETFEIQADILESIVFKAKTDVNEFKLFTIDKDALASDGMVLKALDVIYELDSLTVEKPLIAGLEFVGTFPDFGISYMLGGKAYSYVLNISGKDGRVFLTEMPA